MLIFGITGGTGAGKSSVSEVFRSNGIYVIDADKTARRVTEPGTDCLNELREHFGTSIINEDGGLKRRELGAIVFSDKKQLDVLNEITHKYIYKEIENKLLKTAPELAAIDGAVIIGSPIEEMCSFIVSVVADEDVRLKRIMERDSVSEEEARNRIASQPNESFYADNSKYLIRNNSTPQELTAEAEKVINKIKREFGFE